MNIAYWRLSAFEGMCEDNAVLWEDESKMNKDNSDKGRNEPSHHALTAFRESNFYQGEESTVLNLTPIDAIITATADRIKEIDSRLVGRKAQNNFRPMTGTAEGEAAEEEIENKIPERDLVGDNACTRTFWRIKGGWIPKNPARRFNKYLPTSCEKFMRSIMNLLYKWIPDPDKNPLRMSS